MKSRLLLMAAIALTSSHLQAADSAAATAVNALGLDLLTKTKGDENALLSPYSIQNALAMTYAGADGKTREEMERVLHFPKDDAALNASFAALEKQLTGIEQSTAKIVAESKRGGPKEPVTLAVANRLFSQRGYEFRQPYLNLVKQDYGAPLEQLDFVKEAPQATKFINQWVEEQTRKRIQNLIPDGALTKDTRLVLVNAIYLKAAWEKEFEKSATRDAGFQAKGTDGISVPTMVRTGKMGYSNKEEGYVAVTIPYIGSELQLLLLVPNDPKKLPALEAKLTPELLAGFAKLEPASVEIWLPKFKIEPPLMQLSEQLKALGMKTAFDEPRGSANFDRMAPRKPDDYLYISEVFHKTFLSLDESGTEAAAATAVVMMRAMSMPVEEEKPVAVHVDRPFFFAIQHRETGACLFLGRVNDPR